MLSALVIQLALFGTTQPINFARHVNGLIEACCRKIRGYIHVVQRPTGRDRTSLYATAAFCSALDVGDYSVDSLSRRIRVDTIRQEEGSRYAALQQSNRARKEALRARQAQEAQHLYEQKLCRLCAANVSNSKLLWTRHNAAIAIQLWLRRRRHCRVCSDQL